MVEGVPLTARSHFASHQVRGISPDASHCCLETGVTGLNCVQQKSNSAVPIWQLVLDVLGTSLHRDKGIAVLGDELLQGKIALSLPHTCVAELLLSLKFRRPLVLPCILPSGCQLCLPALFCPLEWLDRGRVRCSSHCLFQFVVDI